MASIIKKIKNGRPYYYVVKSGRVDGKPRIVWQKYLGTAEGILKRMEMVRPPRPSEAVIFEIGAVAALSRAAERLGLVEIVDRCVRKRNQGPSVGEYILLAAINRAIEPRSKRRIGAWYETTALARWWRYSPKAFSSQRFWDHMDLVGEDEILSIEEDLARSLVENFSLELNTLFYDTTNFFTYIDTFNERSTLAQRGNCKAKRHNLRLIGLALLVAERFHVPVLHRAYAGNLNDARQFKRYASEMAETLERAHGVTPGVTLVFDKGNHSGEAFEEIFSGPFCFVAAVKASEHPKLLDVPLDEYEELKAWPGLRAYRSESVMYRETVTLVATFSESFFTKQLATVTREMATCIQKLADLSKRIDEWQKGRRPTRRSVEKNVHVILSPQHMKNLIDCDISVERGLPRLAFSVNHDALEHLSRTQLGKTFIATDNHDWTSEKIVSAYRGQHNVEDAFKDMNHMEFLNFRPQRHWTDQKVRVHALYCVLALTLTALVRRELSLGGLDVSTEKMLTELKRIREVAVLYPPGTPAHRKDHIALSRTTKTQKRMIEILGIEDLLPRRG